MQSEKIITVQLTVKQAKETMLACVERQVHLDHVHQDLLNRKGPTNEIDSIRGRIIRLHRAECALREAIGNV